MSYNVKRATVSGGPYTTIASAPGTNYIDATAVNGTTYYYVVSALNSKGETANSAQVSATPSCTLLAAPTGLSAIAGDSQVPLNWSAVSTATNYNVKRATVTGGPYTTITSRTTTNYTDTTAVNATTYYYVVSSVNTCVESPNSDQVSATPKGTNNAAVVSVSAPSSVLVGQTFSATVTMNNNGTQPWSTPALYRLGSQNPQDNFRWGLNRVDLPVSPINPGQNAAFTFTATAPTNTGTFPFDWRMVQDAVEWFGATATSTVQVTSCALAPVPTGLTATGGNAQITVGWNASSGATSYNVSRATNGSGPYTQIVTGVTTTSYTNTGLASGTAYFYAVSAVNSCGASALSAYRGATTIPAAPTGLSASAGNGQVSLTWTAPTGATSYNVKRATVNGGPYTTIASPTAASYTDTNVVNGMTYYYVVSAVNSSGESPNSSQVSATPTAGSVPPVPTGLTATLTGSNSDVRLNWSASAGASSYKVKRATVSGGPYTVIASPATNTYTDTTPVQGTTYYYVVSAVNAFGESANSLQVSITP
jgi:cellulose 1,4-beta-cellobiosidase